MISDVKEVLKDEGIFGSQDKNRIVLAGFMKFNELSSYIAGQSNEDLSYKLQFVQQLWQQKYEYMDKKLHRVDPYTTPADVVEDFDDSLQPKIEALKKEIRQFPPYDQLNFEIKKVKIDSLLSLQTFIDLDRVKGIEKNITPNMTDKELLDLCVNTNNHDILIEKQSIGGNPFPLNGVATFLTDSDDIRVRQVDFRDVYVHEKHGKPLTNTKAKALVFMFALGDPFIMVHRVQNQSQVLTQVVKRSLFVLNNGFHRAFALKAADYQYIPCVLADLDATEAQTYLAGWKDRINLFSIQRPPLFKDFFNSDLSIQLNIPQRKRFFKLNWNTEIFPIFDKAGVGGE